MDWKIIEYEEKYREKVINFWIEICINEFGFKHWDKDIRKMDNNTYKNNNGNFWLAINNKDEVIGTIALKNLENKKACLKSLYVKKEYRKNGIAKKLFEQFIEFAMVYKYKKIELDTYDKFENAIKFYQKNKFIIKKHIEDKYIMERDV